MARVLVVGAGAIGGLLGALLHEKGHDARLVVRPRSLAALRHGVRLEGGAYGDDRVVPVPALPAAPDMFHPDLVLLATKTQDLREAISEHAHAFGDAPVVALQNGLAQDDIVREALGDARWAAAIVSLDASMTDPGCVEARNPGALMIGPATPAGDAAARILADAVAVQRTRDVRGARWTKLLVNLGNVVPALTNLPFQQTSRHPGLGLAHARLVKEGLAVARAERVKPARIPWTSPTLVRAMGLLPAPIARQAYAARVARVLGDQPAFGSTWQSRARGRSLETEWLNGEIVRRGARHGVATPVNARAVALAEKGLELNADEAAAALLG